MSGWHHNRHNYLGAHFPVCTYCSSPVCVCFYSAPEPEWGCVCKAAFLSLLITPGSCYLWADVRSLCPADGCEVQITWERELAELEPFHFPLCCTWRPKVSLCTRHTVLHSTHSTIHKCTVILFVCFWIVFSIWSSSWQWIHFDRYVTTFTDQSSSPGPETPPPQGSSSSILNQHRGPTLNLAPPPDSSSAQSGQ